MGSMHAEDEGSTVVLAIAYGLLVAAGMYALFSGSHPRTRMIRGFVTIGLLASFFRFLYFAIPDDVWGQPEVPTEPHERFSVSWWTTWIQWIDYSLGNVGFFAQQGIILYFWLAAYTALRRRGADMEDKPDRLYIRAVAIYAAIEFIVVVVYFFSPFFTVICIHSVIQAIMSIALAVIFVALFWRLREALEPAESRALLARKDAGYGSGAARGQQPASVGGGHRGPAEPDAGERERQRKMAKITTIAIVCTVANLFRGCVMVYQSVLFFQGKLVVPSAWWLVILLDYCFTEVFAFAGVLYILRKPPKPAAGGAPTSDAASAEAGGHGYGRSLDAKAAVASQLTPHPAGALAFAPVQPDPSWQLYRSHPHHPQQQEQGAQAREREASSSTLSVLSSKGRRAADDPLLRPAEADARVRQASRGQQGAPPDLLLPSGAQGRRGSASFTSSSAGGSGVSAVSRGQAEGVDLGHVSAAFRDDYDDASSFRGSEGGAGAWASSASSGGRDEDEDDWADGEYGVVLATPTPAGPLLSPSSSVEGLGRSYSLGPSASAGSDQSTDSVPGRQLAAAVSSPGRGGENGEDASDRGLEPVMESVESDAAFPDSVTNRIR